VRSAKRFFHLVSRAGFAALLIFATLPCYLSGQVAGGRISGTVSDKSGSVFPGVTITITNDLTGVSRSQASNENGFYAFPNLIPGSYTVKASASGFGAEVRSGLTLSVGGELAVNLEMQVGDVVERVEVQSDTPLESTTATLSAVINGAEVRELPLNARDWTQLAALEPGVAIVRTQTSTSAFTDRGNRGLGTMVSVAGARPQQNNYRLDGININDYSNSAPGSSLGTDLGVDAIQEFSVITSNATADYGRSSGGVINAVTRSGTNSFHGSVFEFLRNSALDARNYFDPAKIPPFRRNQFGATAGGPIRKDHTFFFGSYEGVRQSLSVTQNAAVPSAAARQGKVDPLVKPYLALYPLPNGGPTSGDIGTFTSVTSQTANQDFFTARLDHTISSKDSLHGTYMFDNAKVQSPDLFSTIVQASLTRRQVGTAEYTRVLTPTLVNTLRFGVSRVTADAGKGLQALVPLASDPNFGFVPGEAVGAINVGGIDPYSGGPAASGEVNYHFTSIQAYNDTFWTKGIHLMKFGISVERLRDNELGTSIPNGAFFFGDLQSFLANSPTRFNSALTGNHVSTRGIRQTVFGAYFEDDAHVRPNLTLNLGLRYEMASVPAEVNGQLTNLRNLTDPQPHTASPYFQNPTLHNFEPRVGFSWDPFRTGRTALRGAFGMYDVLPLTYEYNIVSYLSAPFFLRGSIPNLSPGDFPTQAYNKLLASAPSPGVNPNPFRYSHVDFSPRRNYVINWNLNVQRQIGKDFSLSVGYVGSHGVHQPSRQEDVNTVLPTLTPQGYFWPCDPAQLALGKTCTGFGTKQNPNVGQINGLFWTGSSIYHAAQMRFTGRLGKRLQLNASYTWAKSIDDGSSTIVGDGFLNSISNLPFFDSRLRRGLSDFDIRHNLVVSFMWTVSSPTLGFEPIRWLASGWHVGGIYQLSSGLPFTVNMGGDPLGLASAVTYAFPDRLQGPGCDSAVNPGNPTHYVKTECFAVPNPYWRLGNSGRNFLIGPGLSNADVSLLKDNHLKWISETFNLQFRAEFFNVFNRPNFAPPVSNITLFGFNKAKTLFPAVATAGQISSTATSSRQIQFGLKLTW
jgi:hypothetical protein